MAGNLQRSAVSFRRQGSSGLIWDDKFFSGELKQKQDDNINNKKPQNQENKEVVGLTIARSRSNGGRGFRTGRVSSAAIEPPSPKVSACGFCGAFGKKNNKTRRRPPNSGKRVM
ncbi:hypothetical protein ACJIZ3_025542 [Penstemon smallii]|uniref:MAPK kinase substrate protein n=1 Tax=Penstemon smallii TaxID=265156 RepID=A0ABD3TUX2_9LAMI